MSAAALGAASAADLDPVDDPRELGFDAGRLARIDTMLGEYVDTGALPGTLVVVHRAGRVAHVGVHGRRDVEARLPIERDTLFRLFSMTKPLVSVLAMALYEEGRFELNDPISRWLPEFADMRVFTGGTALKPVTVPATEPIRVWHLLTHTAGFTYGFHRVDPVDELYRARGFDVGSPAGLDLAGCCERWAQLPLLFQPGTEWAYSVATDVLGRLVEVLTGTSLDRALADRVTGPLGMTDTAFTATDPDRLAALYAAVPGANRMRRHDALGKLGLVEPAMLSGGGGLVGTAADYLRFTRMLLGGGAVDGVRVLGSRTVRYLGRNHLPGGADLDTVGRPLFAEVGFPGVGFGLGFAVVEDPVRYRVPCSAGELAWGGLASTAFWVDPAEDLTVSLFTQLMPSSTYPLRTRLRQLVYQALVD